MKKLLTLFYLASFTSVISTNIVSCMKAQENVENLADKIFDKINDKSIFIRNDNLPLDANDSAVKNSLLTKLGLDDNEKLYVAKLIGTLEPDNEVTIKFELSSKPGLNITYKEGEFKVKIEQINKTKPEVQPNFDIKKANNIAILPNDKQITLSNTSNASQVTDSNLNFDTSTSYQLQDSDPTRGVSDVIFSDKYYYAFVQTGYNHLLRCTKFNTLKTNDEYTNFNGGTTYISSLSVNTVKKFISSNNLIYVSTRNDRDKFGIYDITNPNGALPITKSTIFENLNCNDIYDTGTKLYIATDKGLYCSENRKDFTLVPLTDSYNINSITGSKNGTDIFFGTENNGLYYSNDSGTTFRQINNTAGKTINYNSLFLSTNDNLYFGVNNEGLWKTDINGDVAATQLISNHISATNNIKDIAQYYDGTLIVLTDSNLVYLQEF